MNDPIVLVGWLLLHFVWQGTVLALAAASLLWALRGASAQARYAVACGALLAMCAAPPLTARVLTNRVAPPTSGPVRNELVRVEIIRGAPARLDAGALVAPGFPSNRRDAPLTRPLTIVTLIWALGVGVLLTRLAGGWWQLRRLSSAALRLEPSRWQEVGDRLVARLGVRRAVRVIDSLHIDTPTVVGFLTPLVILPVAALAQLTPAQIEAVLAHELAHVRRHDYLVNLLQTVAETLLFYHPAVWWLSRRIRAEREHCCDDVALEVSGDAVGYASALAELEAWRATGSPLALAATGGALTGRIRRLLAVPRAPRRPSLGAALIAALVVAFIGAGTAFQYVTQARGRQTPGGAPAALDQRLERIEWRSVSTDHFDLLMPPALEARAGDIGRRAEQARAQVSRDLDHELRGRIHLVIFESREEMTRITTAGLLPLFGAGTIIRVVVDRDDRALDASLVHEITHAAQSAILGPVEAPLWLTEGLAEHEYGEWSALDQGRLLGLLRNDRLPTLTALTGSPDDTATAYAVGHAIFDFVDDLRGMAGVRRLLASARPADGEEAAARYARAVWLTPETFDAAFRAYLGDRLVTASQAPGLPGPTDQPTRVPRVEEVRLAASDATPRVTFTSDRIRVTGATARDLIRFAYGIEEDTVTGGPDWLDRTRFDVETNGDGDGAHLGSPALRALLEERFRLTLSPRAVPVEGYALTLAEPGRPGPRLTRSTVDCAADAHATPFVPPSERSMASRVNFGPIRCGTHVLASAGRAEGNGVPLAMLARSLVTPLGFDPVVDMTGLRGSFDYLLEFPPFAPRSPNAADRAEARSAMHVAITNAMRDQLGLVLTPYATTRNVIVVERAEFPLPTQAAYEGRPDVLASARRLP